MGRTACTEPQCLHKNALSPLLTETGNPLTQQPTNPIRWEFPEVVDKPRHEGIE